MGTAAALPLFHPDGTPPDNRAFDFIHVESIVARSLVHAWTIRAHRHRNLFQILLIEKGGGTMTYEASGLSFEAPCAILVPPTVAHGFRFRPEATDGWVMSFTEDAAEAIGDRDQGLAHLRALSSDPVVPLSPDCGPMLALAAELHDESSLGRPGYRVAMRALLALIAVQVARIAAKRSRAGPLRPTDGTVDALRGLVDEHFQTDRRLAFYAEKLAITVDRLNELVKCATGVTAGHLIRQRVLREAKHQLVFTSRPINEIASDLAFSDPSHFARFFRRQTGIAPHEFRAAWGG